MKKQFFTILFLFGGMLMSSVAQSIEVKELRLVKEAGSEAFHPKFTPDGQTILLSGEDYAGLKTLDLETGQIRVLTTGAGAGWRAAVSDDSRTVTVRQTDFSTVAWGERQVYSINLENAQMQAVTAVANEVPLATLRNGATMMLRRQATETRPVVYINQDLKLAIERNGQTTVLTPNGADHNYIWATLSPDGTRIAYFVMSLGYAFVSDLNGNVLANLGSNFEAPQWINNDWLVGMDNRDDGRVMLESSIVAITANGNIRQNLTQPNNGKIEMFPAVSPEGNRIAFHTTEGELYIMEISVKR